MIAISNCLITYLVLSSSPTIDPITGNPIFSESTTVSIPASLAESNKTTDFSNLPGVDLNGLLLEGRVEAYPTDLKPGMTVDLIFNDGRQGKFYVLPTTITRLQLEDIFGARLVGVFYEGG